MCHRKGHLESIAIIRQLLAESKLMEAQRALEAKLSMSNISERPELLILYHQVLTQQHKHPPRELLLELSESHLPINPELSHNYLNEIKKSDVAAIFRRFKLASITVASALGRVDELYSLISEFQAYLYEHKVPAIPLMLSDLIDKFFKKDFHLKLQRLALCLQLNDITTAEKLIEDLVEINVEKPAPKGICEKFKQITAVLNASSLEGSLIIYRNFCHFMAEGISDKADYKKLAEIVIFFDSFKFQAHVLNLLDKLGLEEICYGYAKVIKENIKYDFVYFAKFYSHLKKYLVQLPEPEIIESNQPAMDLTLEQPGFQLTNDTQWALEYIDEEAAVISAIKHGNFSQTELLDIATNLIQSRLYKGAASAAELARQQAGPPAELLKAVYLKMISLLHLGDYRAVLDLSIDALAHAEREDDLLSFMYAQAEALVHLGQTDQARKTLDNIVSIQSNYRFAREKLEKLNEI
jgi:hypothetical protein